MRRALPYVLAAIVIVAGLASLKQYGVTWDEALGDLFFGQRYFSFFTTFDSRYLDFKANPYPRGYRPDLTSSAFRNRPWEHYPVASTLATATSRLLAPWLDPFDGYHAFNLIIAAIFVLVFFRFIEDEWGSLAATLTVVFLFLSPRIAGDLEANVKDFSEMAFFSIAAVLVFNAIERGSIRRILFSGIVLGLALGTKANALFLPPVIVLYVLWRGLPPPRKQLALAILGWMVIGGVVFVASWPYLWHNLFQTLHANAIYLLARKSGTAQVNTAGAFTMILYTTPIPFLLSIVAGIVPLARRLRERNHHAILITSWLAVVLGRLALPAAVNFDGVRHFLELFPPLAAVASLGILWIVSHARPIVRASVAAVVALIMAVPLVRTHPFEAAYWNAICGGLRGAMARRIPQAGDYWAASYRIGLRWINEHAPRGSVLVVPIAEHTVRIQEDYRLRPDIGLAHVTNAWSPRVDYAAYLALHEMSQTRPVYVMTILRRDWTNQIVIEAFGRDQPVALWTLDGAPVLVIFRMTRNK